MFQKILFAVGDDVASDAAVPVVASYARHLAADVHVLHVHRVGEDPGNGELRRMLKSVQERLHAEGVHVGGEVRLARSSRGIASVITRAATEVGAELVAIGSRGRTDLGGLFLGSVSHRVAAGLQLPVLVVRTSPAICLPPRKVLVATDGSVASDRAIAEAAEIARQSHATVRVLHVRPLITTLGGAFVEPEEDARAIVDRALAAAREVGVEAEGKIVVSQTDTAEAIASISESENIDLVVIASRRPSELSGLLLGSVAHSVIHRLSRPVLLASRVRAAKGFAGTRTSNPEHR
jgi:nucleotide-binding universal stress UspA family protein